MYPISVISIIIRIINAIYLLSNCQYVLLVCVISISVLSWHFLCPRTLCSIRAFPVLFVYRQCREFDVVFLCICNLYTVLSRLLHSCHSHSCYTVVTHLLDCCHTVVTLLLHCCHTVTGPGLVLRSSGVGFRSPILECRPACVCVCVCVCMCVCVCLCVCMHLFSGSVQYKCPGLTVEMCVSVVWK
jgi:hypothetical protein